jgi:hypothetical protein
MNRNRVIFTIDIFFNPFIFRITEMQRLDSTKEKNKSTGGAGMEKVAEERIQTAIKAAVEAMQAIDFRSEGDMEPVGWIITKDYIASADFNDRPQVGRVSAYWDEHKQKAATTPFRLYDGDDDCYYQGLLINGDYCESQFDALRWGEAFAGCTTIKVKRDGKWEQDIS